MKGINCPRCGCRHFFVRNVIRLPKDKIRRYRVCRNCEKVVTTIEMCIGDLPLMPMVQ